jgi:hypothetical protein
MIRGIVTFVVVFFLLAFLISLFGLVGQWEVVFLVVVAALLAVGDYRLRAQRKPAG